MEGTSALHTPYALRQLRQNLPAVSPSEICPDPPRPQKESRSFGSSADWVNDDLHLGSPAESQPQFRASPLPSPLPSLRRPTALNLRLESSLGQGTHSRLVAHPSPLPSPPHHYVGAVICHTTTPTQAVCITCSHHLALSPRLLLTHYQVSQHYRHPCWEGLWNDVFHLGKIS